MTSVSFSSWDVSGPSHPCLVWRLPDTPATCAIWLLLASDIPSVDQLFVSWGLDVQWFQESAVPFLQETSSSNPKKFGVSWTQHALALILHDAIPCHTDRILYQNWGSSTKVSSQSCTWSVKIMGKTSSLSLLDFQLPAVSKKAHRSVSYGAASLSPQFLLTSWLVKVYKKPGSLLALQNANKKKHQRSEIAECWGFTCSKLLKIEKIQNCCTKEIHFLDSSLTSVSKKACFCCELRKSRGSVKLDTLAMETSPAFSWKKNKKKPLKKMVGKYWSHKF